MINALQRVIRVSSADHFFFTSTYPLLRFYGSQLLWVCGREQGICPWLAGKSRGNTIGVSENTFGVFEISFGVLHFSADRLLIVVDDLLEFFALALLLGFSAGENLFDGPRNQAQGVYADGHSSTDLCLALFLQPVTLIGQLHVSA